MRRILGMTYSAAGYMLFAAATTAYIHIASQFEERHLKRSHGEHYRPYQRRAGRLLPLPRLKKCGKRLPDPARTDSQFVEPWR